MYHIATYNCNPPLIVSSITRAASPKPTHAVSSPQSAIPPAFPPPPHCWADNPIIHHNPVQIHQQESQSSDTATSFYTAVYPHHGSLASSLSAVLGITGAISTSIAASFQCLAYATRYASRTALRACNVCGASDSMLSLHCARIYSVAGRKGSVLHSALKVGPAVFEVVCADECPGVVVLVGVEGDEGYVGSLVELGLYLF